MTRSLSIGIDVGGTFTDLFMVDQSTGETFQHKLSSTPEDPHEAPIRGIREILQAAHRQPRDVRFVGLGTTVATNALLERKGAKVGLITTRGFRDLLEIARQTRPHVYDLTRRRSEPLVPRYLRLEAEERIAWNGSVVRGLNLGDVDRVVSEFQSQGVEAVAICFLNSYANPDHERRAVAHLREIWPEAIISASQELIPEYREYERLSSTVTNAYLMPVMQRYMGQFQNAIRALSIPVEPVVMSSSGGVFSPTLAAQRPIDTLLSGPSGGISGAVHLTGLGQRRDIITLDMGGTSTDVSVVINGQSEICNCRVIDGLPIKSMSVDVHTVGAGGSSVAWLDTGGMLRVGPHSAGAKPGPACYGIGGTLPTVTDANVLLGRLNQKHLLGGALKIDAWRSEDCIDRRIAHARQITAVEAAVAIIAIANTHIAQAIRSVSVERGLDPQAFLLVAYGGAGPLHAADVARELNMDVLVPASPGVLCAMGVLMKDAQIDLSQTRLLRQNAASASEQVEEIFAKLEERAIALIGMEGQSPGAITVTRFVDARYVGQNFELSFQISYDAQRFDMQAARVAFEAVHRRFYGYDHVSNEMEIVTLRLRASVPGPKIDVYRQPLVARAGALRPKAMRTVVFDPAMNPVECPVFDRQELRPGDDIKGAAIIEQMDTTTLVPPDFHATVDGTSSLLLSRQ